jgi:hypothetical protein
MVDRLGGRSILLSFPSAQPLSLSAVRQEKVRTEFKLGDINFVR